MIRSALLVLVLALVSVRAHALYGVEEALNDASTDQLTLVGTYVPAYAEDGKMKMCVYRGAKTLVYSFYCTKASVPAAWMRIVSADPTKGSVEIYAEVPMNVDVTTAKRDQYDEQNFRMSVNPPDGFDFNGSIDALRKYDDKLSKNPRAACFYTKRAGAWCRSNYQSEMSVWMPPTLAFWVNPSESWYSLQALLKSRI